MRTLAVDIGGTKCSVGVVEGGKIVIRQSQQYPASVNASVVRSLLRDMIAAIDSHSDVCGVAFGGAFDYAAQRCKRSFHVDGWQDFPINEWLFELLEIPVRIDNDANVAALGEYAERGSRAGNPMVYVTVSTGVGAAIVFDGRVVRGAHNLAGELGHFDVGHMLECSCGQVGCLERACSGYWIKKDQGVDAEVYLEEPESFASWVRNLGKGLWGAVTLIDPAVLVVGGGMAAQGERLLSALHEELEGYARAGQRPVPRIELGDATGRTVLLGAARLAEEAAV